MGKPAFCHADQLRTDPAFERTRPLNADERAAIEVLRRRMWSLSAKCRCANGDEPGLRWDRAQLVALDWLLDQVGRPPTAAEMIRESETLRL